ncbi:hypothetical protein BVY00_02440 [bacterium G20]|nr:hypothetical protein BVY00_02440 [bacterium G20]
MSKPEELSGHDKVAERTAQLAEEAGTRAAHEAEQYLGDYVGEGGALTQEQLDAIVADKKAKAIERYTVERNAGLYNNEASLSPGLTALVAPYEEGELSHPALQAGQLEFDSPSIEEVGELEGRKLYKLRLPEGVFKDVNIGHVFYVKAQTDGLGRVHGEREDRFILGTGSVIRIEGDQGDLWQDIYRNPDGSPNQELITERARLGRAEARRREREGWDELARETLAAAGVQTPESE